MYMFENLYICMLMLSWFGRMWIRLTDNGVYTERKKQQSHCMVNSNNTPFLQGNDDDS